jgi:MFS family permease
MSVVNIATVAGNFTFGITVDKMGSRLSTIIALVLLSAGLILLSGLKVLWGYYLFAALYGIGWGILNISRSTIIAELFGLRSHGILIGIIILLYSVGGTLGPITAGYIFDVSRHYQYAFILIAGLSLISLVISPLLRARVRE